MILAFIAIAIVSFAIFYFVFHESSGTKTVIVDVVDVIDGRAVEVLRDGRKERVILGGIGFPPADQKSEQDCEDALRGIVVGRRLYMEIFREVEGCKYVALQSSNGDCMNSMMLTKGLARYESTGVGFVSKLITAENEARKNGVGVWDKNRALFKHISGDLSSSEFSEEAEV